MSSPPALLFKVIVTERCRLSSLHQGDYFLTPTGVLCCALRTLEKDNPNCFTNACRVLDDKPLSLKPSAWVTHLLNLDLDIDLDAA